MLARCLQAIGRLTARDARPVLGEARARDVERLAAIHAEGFERGWDAHEFARMLLEPTTSAHVIRPGGRGQPVAFALSRLAADEAEVLTVAVSSSCRGQGLGTAVFEGHLGRLAGQGVRTVFLEVSADNAPAIRLYRSAGFEEVGRRKGYYRRRSGDAVTALVMRRALV